MGEPVASEPRLFVGQVRRPARTWLGVMRWLRTKDNIGLLPLRRVAGDPVVARDLHSVYCNVWDLRFQARQPFGARCDMSDLVGTGVTWGVRLGITDSQALLPAGCIRIEL